MTFTRIALLTTVSLLCISTAPAALAANDKLTSIISNNGDEVDTDTLNQAMLNLMKSRDAAGTSQQTASNPAPCPTNPALTDASPECLANIAPAAGDDGGDEAEESPDAEGDDSVNDELPPAEDPPEEEPPTEEEPPVEEEPGCDGECGGEEETPPEDVPEDNDYEGNDRET